MLKAVVLFAGLVALASAQNGLNFVALGDWGGESNAPYTTPYESATAAGMAKVASEINSQFVLALGDNFYSEV